ncbi:MAG TPA: hypothetical protein IAA60_07075 [Candidatus Ornithomonoglobus intestinigallinarum]|uniref:Uncharacterized protein n=1 Tax=Candidatus Ornithomonoglobus intestinigallinarum TaxID=2840894 RepID=A0A9D1H3L9_9FIRM|nr:hypothetical protein [Candidatus Ornithomonoglobus intestinigallinarum]
MSKKILCLVITVFAGLLFSITAFAEANSKTDNEVVHVSTAEELKAQMPSSGYEPINDIVLDNDIEVSFTVYVTLETLNLNGHTLTITPSQGAAVWIIGGAVENGTIIVNPSAGPSIGIYNIDGSSMIENVELKTAEGALLDAAVAVDKTLAINNCTMVSVNLKENGAMFGNAGAATIAINSGNYKDLSFTSFSTVTVADTISPAEGSKAVENLDGVNGMVIASPQTKAIVVKDGKAYTYDSFEEAKADAAVADGAELLQHKGNFVFGIPVIWASETDAGYYIDAETKYGVIRFLFDSGVEADKIMGSGIKFVNSADFIKPVEASGDLSGNKSAFYGDITEIPEANADTTYYAVAYVTTTDGSTSWSNVVECTPDFNTLINYEGGNE